jgi:hypothetical protein
MPTSLKDCAFDRLAIALAIAYGLILLAVVRHLVSLMRLPTRYEQKVFLVLTICVCALRSVFFALWPKLGPTCSPTLTDGTYEMLYTLGVAPVVPFMFGR